MADTATTSKVQYKNLYSQIKDVQMIIANAAEDHVEYNEPLHDALHKCKMFHYGSMTEQELIGLGFEPKSDDYDEQLEEWIYKQDDPYVYQTFITDEEGHDLFDDYGYPAWYNEEMDLHFIGITHFGTHWSHDMDKQPVHNKEKYAL